MSAVSAPLVTMLTHAGVSSHSIDIACDAMASMHISTALDVMCSAT